MAPVTEDILGCHIFVIKRTCKIKVLYNTKLDNLFVTISNILQYFIHNNKTEYKNSLKTIYRLYMYRLLIGYYKDRK